jgi:dolichol kinase
MPFAIGLTFYCTLLLDNSLYFNVSIWVLALSDPLACYFGQSFPSKRLVYGKTLIGTLAFFLSTFIICVVYLAASTTGMKAVWMALGTSMTASVAELLSPRGSDNVTIPLAIIASLLIWA